MAKVLVGEPKRLGVFPWGGLNPRLFPGLGRRFSTTGGRKGLGFGAYLDLGIWGGWGKREFGVSPRVYFKNLIGGAGKNFIFRGGNIGGYLDGIFSGRGGLKLWGTTGSHNFGVFKSHTFWGG